MDRSVAMLEARLEAIVILALEVLGVLAAAAGVTVGLLSLIGWSSLAVGGLVVLGSVVASGWLQKPSRRGR